MVQQSRAKESTQVSTAELWKKAFAGLGMSDCRAIPEDAPSKTQLGATGDGLIVFL